jgi:hypothetical protein
MSAAAKSCGYGCEAASFYFREFSRACWRFSAARRSARFKAMPKANTCSAVPPMPGRLAMLDVARGDQVAAGATLFRGMPLWAQAIGRPWISAMRAVPCGKHAMPPAFNFGENFEDE